MLLIDKTAKEIHLLSPGEAVEINAELKTLIYQRLNPPMEFCVESALYQSPINDAMMQRCNP